MTEVLTFKDFIREFATQDRLPFSIRLGIRRGFEEKPSEEIAGFKLAKFNELLARETWFFNKLSDQDLGSRKTLLGTLRELSKKLQEACSIESITDAAEYLFSPPKDVADSDDYQQFIEDNKSNLDKIYEIQGSMRDDNVVRWLQITFFLASRYDEEWELGDTMSLPPSQLNDLAAFIQKEANGGKEPEPVDTSEDLPDEGK